jgi:hypothetical protein
MHLEKITINLGEGRAYEIDPENELAISEEGINEFLKNQPSLYAWYATLQEMTESELANAKLLLELTESKLDDKYRKILASEGAKVTESMVEKRLHLDEEYIEAITNANLWKKNSGILRGLKEACAHRKDMLITLASNLRAQMDPEIFVRKQEHQHRDATLQNKA